MIGFRQIVILCLDYRCLMKMQQKYKQGDVAGRCEIKIHHDLSSLRTKVFFPCKTILIICVTVDGRKLEEIWPTTWDV